MYPGRNSSTLNEVVRDASRNPFKPGAMKFFHPFRLDPANHCLWREDERVSIPPKVYDVLRYLVENPGRLVTQDELLEKLWPDTYVNPEVIRKYILEIRRTLGDRLDKPEFIETLPKRGYRFVASVRDENSTDQSDGATSLQAYENVTDLEPRTVESRPEPGGPTGKGYFFKLAIVPALAIIALMVMGIYLRSARAGSSASSSNNVSIAVLPFADMSQSKDQEYFSDGLSEQLIHELARVPSLKVVARSSAFQFKGKNEDLRSVGRKLGVANVLEGSVRRDGNHLRITAELIKAEDGFQLWSQTYDREINDIFAVQDDIARAATEAMQLKLLAGNGQQVPLGLRSSNPEAYQAYLQANYFDMRGQGKELAKALVYADTAISLDQKYAPAWALRASVESKMAEVGLADVTAGFQEARQNAQRALELDPNSAAAYLALATVQIDSDWDWTGAETSVTKAANSEPGNVEVLGRRSYLSRISGNLDQAIELEKRAVALDPLRPGSQSTLGYMLYSAGRYDEAQTALQKALDLNPQTALVHLTLSKILVAEGNAQKAATEIENESMDWGKLTGKALAYHALGREQDSTAALHALIAKYGADASYQIAQIYAYRGESNKSFEWLERARKQRDAGLPDIKTDPLFKSLRSDARYSELLKTLRLPAQ
jgi:TolB-like protein/DNA-binding winged helix-turn-helix (wHTH) protein/Tfp pilus assembly protein PilF